MSAPVLQLKDLYALMVQEFGDVDVWELTDRGAYWVMDLDSYRQVRAAAKAAGAVYPPDDDPGEWVPKPEDRLFGLTIEVRDGASPHLEFPAQALAYRGSSE